LPEVTLALTQTVMTASDNLNQNRLLQYFMTINLFPHLTQVFAIYVLKLIYTNCAVFGAD
jgi:hypothetical protein